jgi:hypothetical protein
MKSIKKNYIAPIVSAIVLGILGVFFMANFFFESRVDTITVITRDLDRLTKIFETIDNTCGIMGFDQQKSVINFLNTVSFVGSEVGSVNLRYPKKWKGPYLADNPTIQGKEYQVVRTVKGHFITPGDGVKLPSGKVIGKDIKLDEHADIALMMHQNDVLLFNNKSLAASLVLSGISGTMVMDDDGDYCC